MKKYKIIVPVLLLAIIILLKLTSGSNEQLKNNNLLAIDNTSSSSISLKNKVKIDITELGTMNASWYGPRFHGRLTANGEIYDQMAYTAAHKSLPFGTLLRLTNEKNNKSVIVRINDRGPYIPGRQIDLSKMVAMELGTYNKGVVKLKIEQIEVSGLDTPLIDG